MAFPLGLKYKIIPICIVDTNVGKGHTSIK